MTLRMMMVSNKIHNDWWKLLPIYCSIKSQKEEGCCKFEVPPQRYPLPTKYYSEHIMHSPFYIHL